MRQVGGDPPQPQRGASRRTRSIEGFRSERGMVERSRVGDEPQQHPQEPLSSCHIPQESPSHAAFFDLHDAGKIVSHGRRIVLKLWERDYGGGLLAGALERLKGLPEPET